MMQTENDPRFLNLAVVDDDAAFIKQIRGSLHRHFADDPSGWALSTYPDAEAFWVGHLRNRHNVAMLDVMLPGESGIELARRIYNADKRTVIIFVTASSDHVYHGYGVNAIGYVLKPIDDGTIADLLRECRKRLAPAPGRHIMLKTEIGRVAVSFHSITHIESYYRKVRVYADNETLTCSGRLNEYLPQLNEHFIQVHKSFVVNMKRVRSIKYDSLLLDNDAVVPISRSRNRELQDRYFAILSEDGDDA